MCEPGSITISDVSQITSISACPTFTGSVTFGEAIEGDVTIDATEEFIGDIIIENTAQLSSFSMPTLQRLTGDFHVYNTAELHELQLPELTTVHNLTLDSTGTEFTALNFGKLTTATNVIINSTSLKALEGLLALTSVEGDVIIENNPDLTDVNLFLTSSTGLLQITNNGNNETAIIMVDLVSVSSLIVTSASSISVPKLNNTGVNIYSNPSLDTLSLDGLEYADNLIVVNNEALTSLSATKLVTAATNNDPETADELDPTINISGNPMLETISLPVLETIDSADFVGNFTSVDLPALTTINQKLLINSTSDISSTCSHFESLFPTPSDNHNNLTCIYPGYVFQDGHVVPSETGGGNNTAKKVGGGLGGTIAFFILAALAILGWWYFRMQKRKNKSQGFGAGGGRGWNRAADGEEGVELK